MNLLCPLPPLIPLFLHHRLLPRSLLLLTVVPGYQEWNQQMCMKLIALLTWRHLFTQGWNHATQVWNWVEIQLWILFGRPQLLPRFMTEKKLRKVTREIWQEKDLDVLWKVMQLDYSSHFQWRKLFTGDYFVCDIIIGWRKKPSQEFKMAIANETIHREFWKRIENESFRVSISVLFISFPFLFSF